MNLGFRDSQEEHKNLVESPREEVLTTPKLEEKTSSKTGAKLKQQQEFRKRFRSYLIGSLSVSALALVGGYVGLFHSKFDVLPAANDLDRAAQAYRDAGFYWTADQLHVAVPASQNAAPLLKKADEQLPNNNLKFPSVSYKASLLPAQLAIDSIEPALDSAVLASQYEKLDMGRDWDNAMGNLDADIYEDGTLINGLCLRAEIEATQGNSQAAERDLSASLRLSRLIGQEPSTTSVGFALQYEQTTLQATLYCASLESTDRSALTGLLRSVSENQFAPDIQELIRDEAYQQLASIRNLSDAELSARSNPGANQFLNKPNPKRSGYPDGYLGRAVLDKCLSHWTEVENQVEAAGSDPIRLNSAFEQINRKIVGEQSDPKHGFSNDIMFKSHLSPIISGVMEQLQVYQADAVVTRAMLSALIQKAETGKLPTKISDIPGTWIDPYTGTPLKLKMVGDSLRIYSVGIYQQDGGGTTYHGEGQGGRSDIIASFPPMRNIYITPGRPTNPSATSSSDGSLLTD